MDVSQRRPNRELSRALPWRRNHLSRFWFRGRLRLFNGGLRLAALTRRRELRSPGRGHIFGSSRNLRKREVIVTQKQCYHPIVQAANLGGAVPSCNGALLDYQPLEFRFASFRVLRAGPRRRDDGLGLFCVLLFRGRRGRCLMLRSSWRLQGVSAAPKTFVPCMRGGTSEGAISTGCCSPVGSEAGFLSSSPTPVFDSSTDLSTGTAEVADGSSEEPTVRDRFADVFLTDSLDC